MTFDDWWRYDDSWIGSRMIEDVPYEEMARAAWNAAKREDDELAALAEGLVLALEFSQEPKPGSSAACTIMRIKDLLRNRRR